MISVERRWVTHGITRWDTHFVSMDPPNYSWFQKNGFLLPDKCLCQLPPTLLKICKSCKRCSTKRCVLEISWKLHSILLLWSKISKYLQHCVRTIHLLKAIVYSLPASHLLVYPEQIFTLLVLK